MTRDTCESTLQHVDRIVKEIFAPQENRNYVLFAGPPVPGTEVFKKIYILLERFNYTKVERLV